MTRACVLGDFGGDVQNLKDTDAAPVEFTVETVADVGRNAPKLADAFPPFPGFVLTPLANAQNDGSATCLDGVAHGHVGCFGTLLLAVAPVVFQIVDTPFGILAGILKLVTPAAWARLTGHAASTGIYAEFQPAFVYVIGQRLHSMGKSGGIGNDVSFGVPGNLPTVINDNIFVSGIFHTGGNHVVGHLTNEGIADVAAELVPTVPAHGRSQGQFFWRCFFWVRISK